MIKNLTPEARSALDRARQIAKEYCHQFVGTEHLLVAVLMEDQAGCAHVLESFGADINEIRQEIERLIQRGSEDVAFGELPMTPRAMRAVAFAADSAKNLSLTNVGTEHLLIGLIREPDGVAAQVLRNLGVRNVRVVEELLKTRLLQLKIVERAVRPLQAGMARKRKMREELLAHLSAIYDEERSHLTDPMAAVEAAAERFGEPRLLARELQSTIPVLERWNYRFERRFGWRAPETAATWVRRMTVQLFVAIAIVCCLNATAILVFIGTTGREWSVMRPALALLVFVPTATYLVGRLYFKLRDTLFGVFGARQSHSKAVGLTALIGVIVFVASVGCIALSTWSLSRAEEAVNVFGVAAALAAIACYAFARTVGRQEIRDAIWECLDLKIEDGENPPNADPGAPILKPA